LLHTNGVVLTGATQNPLVKLNPELHWAHKTDWKLNSDVNWYEHIAQFAILYGHARGWQIFIVTPPDNTKLSFVYPALHCPQD
jgi:hypothetical protein